MKKLFLLSLLFAAFITSSAQVKVQAEKSETMSFKELDSLMLKKTKSVIDYNNESTSPVTRGISQQDPCKKALSDLSDLYGSLKTIYRNCCRGESSVIASGVVLYKIWKLWDSTSCIWDDNPQMYAAALYYQIDFENFKKRSYCSYDCGQ